MIKFTKQTWYNKDDVANEDKRIPISAYHLNRIEDALSETVDFTNVMTRHWWTVSKLAGGEVYIPSTSSSSTIEMISSSSNSETVNVYYSDTVNVVEDEGVLYAQLVNPTKWELSYTSHGGSNRQDLYLKYYIIGAQNTRDGATLYYCVGNTAVTSSGGKFFVKSVKTYVADIRDVYEVNGLVSSSSRDGYPDGLSKNTGLIYHYLGIPFENARNGMRLETGSYVGTGVYGSIYTNTLTFGGKPYLVFIPGTESLTFVRGGNGNSHNYYDEDTPTVWGENSITYYGTNATWNSSFNSAGKTYEYIAIVV